MSLITGKLRGAAANNVASFRASGEAMLRKRATVPSAGTSSSMCSSPSTGALSVTSDVEDGQDPFTVTAVSISH